MNSRKLLLSFFVVLFLLTNVACMNNKIRSQNTIDGYENNTQISADVSKNNDNENALNNQPFVATNNQDTSSLLNCGSTKYSIEKLVDADLSQSNEMVIVDKKIWYINDNKILNLDINTKEAKEYKTIDKLNKIVNSGNRLWFYYSRMEESFGENKLEYPLIKYNLENSEFTEYSPVQLDVEGIYGICSIGNKDLINGGNKVIEIDNSNNSIKIPIRSTSFISSVVSNSKLTWFGLFGEGVNETENEANSSVYNTANSLKSNLITQLYLNNENLWVEYGGEGETWGLSSMNLLTKKWRHFIGYTTDDKLISEIDPDMGQGSEGYVEMNEDGLIWINFYKYISIFNDKNNKWDKYYIPKEYYDSVLKVTDINLINKMLVICSEQGLLSINQNTLEVEDIIKNNSIFNFWVIDNNNCIVVAKDGFYKLIISTD